MILTNQDIKMSQESYPDPVFCMKYIIYMLITTPSGFSCVLQRIFDGRKVDRLEN